MLESEETQLVPIDPEIEKTLKQLRKELKEAKKKKKSEMGDQQPLLRDLWIPKDQSIATGVVQPVIQANNFELKPSLITMIQHSQFGGSATKDPHDHIRTFLEYCNTLKCNGVTADAIRLSLFPFSLRDGAKIWLHSLPVHLKDTWEHLLQTFLERYFPPTKAAEFRDKITRFAQFDGESLYDAWQRFQTLIRMCPHHGLEKWLILQTFYKGLTHQTRAFVDSAAGGGIMNKTLDEAFELIESMASHHFQWSSERATPPQQPGIFQLSSSDSIAAQVEILNKQMTQILSAGSSSVTSSVQSIQACQICGISGHLPVECTFYTSAESSVLEVNFAQNQGPFSQSYNPSWRNHSNLSYRSNQSMQPYPSNASNLGFRNQQQQQQFGNQRQQGFQGNSSLGMDDIIKMQLELMNKMTSEVSTIKDSMQNLTTRMDNLVASQAANSSEPKMPSQSEANPRGHCGSITTRGGTVISLVVPNSQRPGILPTPVAETPPSIPLPAQPAYVPPALRNNVQSDKQQEVENDKSSARPSVSKPINLELVRIPFPERLEKSKEDKQFAKFLEIMKDVQITIPILDAVLHIPLYAKFFKDLLSKKRTIDEPEIVTLTKECNAILQNTLPAKLDDPGSFCVPCHIGTKKFIALCDLGSSVSVLPHSVCKLMSLGDLRPTSMKLQLADRTIRHPAGILSDVPIVVDQFAYPVDFMVLEMEDNSEVVILGRLFLATAGAVIDVKGAKLKLRFGEDEIVFDMKHPTHILQRND